MYCTCDCEWHRNVLKCHVYFCVRVKILLETKSAVSFLQMNPVFKLIQPSKIKLKHLCKEGGKKGARVLVRDEQQLSLWGPVLKSPQ